MKYLWVLSCFAAIRSVGQIQPCSCASVQGIVRVGHSRSFYIGNKRFVPKGVNYYPANTPWRLFWSKYDSNIVDKDLQRISAMHFNTVRVFIDVLRNDSAVSGQLNHVSDFIDRSGRKGLKVIITLFDFIDTYSPTEGPVTCQMRSLIARFRCHPALMAWDIKNEPDLDFSQDRQPVLSWLQSTLQMVRFNDCCHLLTIGWAHPENASLLSDSVDFVSFHSYRHPDTLTADLHRLLPKVRDKPVLLEEFGFSTFDSSAGHRKGERNQSRYFAAIRRRLHESGEIPWLVWTMYDFSSVPAGIGGHSEETRIMQTAYGLITDDGRVKPGAKLLAR